MVLSYIYNKLEEAGGVAIVEMLYTTNLLAVVGTDDKSTFSRARLTIWNTNNNTGICELSFISPIVYVRMNKQRYDVYYIYIYIFIYIYIYK